MSLVLQRIEETRDALVDALAERNWDAIGELDWLAVPAWKTSEEARWTRPRCAKTLRSCWGLQAIARGGNRERQAIVDEMSQITQAQNAAKVYHLFG
jgi:hypothetical protein